MIRSGMEKCLQSLEGSLEHKILPLQQGVLRWGLKRGARYEWRQTGKTPYEVFVGEFWLTHAPPAIITEIVTSFLQAFPSLQSLCAAKEEEITQFLDHFATQFDAQNIKITAKSLFRIGQGEFPRDSDSLHMCGLGLCGTEAVFCFGYGLPLAVLDENVSRMLHRVFYRILPLSPNRGLMHAIASAVLSNDNPQEFNRRILELAETVCTAEKPDCADCPIQSVCDWANAIYDGVPDDCTQGEVPRTLVLLH